MWELRRIRPLPFFVFASYHSLYFSQRTCIPLSLCLYIFWCKRQVLSYKIELQHSEPESLVDRGNLRKLSEWIELAWGYCWEVFISGWSVLIKYQSLLENLQMHFSDEANIRKIIKENGKKKRTDTIPLVPGCLISETAELQHWQHKVILSHVLATILTFDRLIVNTKLRTANKSEIGCMASESVPFADSPRD